MTLTPPTTTLAWTYDVDTLTQMIMAFMRSGSAQGSRTSPNILTAYRLGVRSFVPWAQKNGVQLLRPGRRAYLAYLQERPGRGRGHAGQPAHVRADTPGPDTVHREAPAGPG